MEMCVILNAEQVPTRLRSMLYQHLSDNAHSFAVYERIDKTLAIVACMYEDVWVDIQRMCPELELRRTLSEQEYIAHGPYVHAPYTHPRIIATKLTELEQSP